MTYYLQVSGAAELILYQTRMIEIYFNRVERHLFRRAQPTHQMPRTI